MTSTLLAMCHHNTAPDWEELRERLEEETPAEPTPTESAAEEVDRPEPVAPDADD
ncbi:MAG: hypothetical protein ABEJ35_04550 [Halobacteriaceae archaeon]